MSRTFLVNKKLKLMNNPIFFGLLINNILMKNTEPKLYLFSTDDEEEEALLMMTTNSIQMMTILYR